MALLEQLNEDMKHAMRAKDKFRLGVIRMVIAAIKNVEIDVRRSLEEGEVQDIVQREIKQRRDAMGEFEKAGREDLVEQSKQELDVLIGYMPQQLSETEIRSIVQDAIRSVAASTKADMGKVMGAVLPHVKGRADGKVVNQLVQSELAALS
jgi:uncharacterized protein YqeY